MSLVMTIDGDRWRAHLQKVEAEYPGLIPVAKGNGYGFGIGRLARRAAWLAVPTLAVGTYEELNDAWNRFDGNIVVLTPWRPFLHCPFDPRLIHTVGRPEDLIALDKQRVVLEVATSMRRHGFKPHDLVMALTVSLAEVVAISVHLPLPGPENAAEFAEIMAVIAPGAAAAGINEVWVSHLSGEQLRNAPSYGMRLRPRVGTQLWLGDPGSLSISSHVLDVHLIKRGEAYGYRRRTAKSDSTILIVSGGTAHGVGLEAPGGSMAPRDRAARVARGGLDALGKVRSPFFVGDHQARFAEPPHMQSSMLMLPQGVPVPQIGDRVRARLGHTATRFDRIEIQ